MLSLEMPDTTESQLLFKLVTSRTRHIRDWLMPTQYFFGAKYWVARGNQSLSWDVVQGYPIFQWDSSFSPMGVVLKPYVHRFSGTIILDNPHMFIDFPYERGYPLVSSARTRRMWLTCLTWRVHRPNFSSEISRRRKILRGISFGVPNCQSV